MKKGQVRCRRKEPDASDRSEIGARDDDLGIELCVFEDGRDRSTRQVFGNGVYQLTRISDLAKRIDEPWCDGRRLSDEQAVRLVRLFKPGKYVHPAMSGDYQIVERRGTFAAANGLSYSLSQLRHALLQIPRLGKFYDVEPLAEPEMKAFMVQVKRHAQVIGQMGRHPGIIGFHDMVTDEPRTSRALMGTCALLAEACAPSG